MKAKRIEELLDAIKSLHKKAKKAAQAQAKVEDKLAHVETLLKALYYQVKDEQDHQEKPDKSAKKTKKSKKKDKPEALNVQELAQLAAESNEKTAQL